MLRAIGVGRWRAVPQCQPTRRAKGVGHVHGGTGGQEGWPGQAGSGAVWRADPSSSASHVPSRPLLVPTTPPCPPLNPVYNPAPVSPSVPTEQCWVSPCTQLGTDSVGILYLPHTGHSSRVRTMTPHSHAPSPVSCTVTWKEMVPGTPGCFSTST